MSRLNLYPGTDAEIILETKSWFFAFRDEKVNAYRFENRQAIFDHSVLLSKDEKDVVIEFNLDDEPIYFTEYPKAVINAEDFHQGERFFRESIQKKEQQQQEQLEIAELFL